MFNPFEDELPKLTLEQRVDRIERTLNRVAQRLELADNDMFEHATLIEVIEVVKMLRVNGE